MKCPHCFRVYLPTGRQRRPRPELLGYEVGSGASLHILEEMFSHVKACVKVSRIIHDVRMESLPQNTG